MPTKIGNRTVYYIGETETTQFTNLTTKTNQILIYNELIKLYSIDNQFTDVDFPADNSSIGKLNLDAAQQTTYPKWDKTIHWMRAKEACYNLVKHKNIPKSDLQIYFQLSDEKSSATLAKSRFDVKQGAIGDCWFIAGLSQITQQREIVDFIIPNENQLNMDSGLYHFRFFHYGCWVDIVIDDYLPCVQFFGPDKRWTLLTCQIPRDGNKFELWPVLVEKAYAKLHGTYGAIEGNLPRFALENLTGGISTYLMLNDNEVSSYPTLFELLNIVKDLSFINFWTSNKKQSAASTKGIATQHSYPLTRIEVFPGSADSSLPNRLLRLRNPWGHGEWTGTWSDQSAEMNALSAEMKSKLELITADDGEFWIDFQDVIRYFCQVDCCLWFPDDKMDGVIEKFDFRTEYGKWEKGIPGGKATPHLNPQYAVKLIGGNHEGNGLLIIHQELKLPLKSKVPGNGFLIYAMDEPGIWKEYINPKDNDVCKLPKEFFDTNVTMVKFTEPQLDGKEDWSYAHRVTSGYLLPIGMYCIVPVLLETHEDKAFEYVLRIGVQKRSRFETMLTDNKKKLPKNIVQDFMDDDIIYLDDINEGIDKFVNDSIDLADSAVSDATTFDQQLTADVTDDLKFIDNIVDEVESKINHAILK